jgi:hypothetical protein
MAQMSSITGRNAENANEAGALIKGNGKVVEETDQAARMKHFVDDLVAVIGSCKSKLNEQNAHIYDNGENNAFFDLVGDKQTGDDR